MLIRSEKYSVLISENAPSVPRDCVLNYIERSSDDLLKEFIIHVQSASMEYRLAIVGSYLSDDKNCAVLEDDVLTVLMNDQIFRINLQTQSLIQLIRVENFDCGIAIYRVDNGYLLYGEMEIYMLDADFKTKWRFSGLDIFITLNGDKGFSMDEKMIYLEDFLGNRYMVSHEGKLIKKY